MNFANALGFFVLGVAMWTLPLVAPGLFPPSAIDGSSTRALWLQAMGLVQTVIGLSYVLSGYARVLRATATNPVPRGATATADWMGDAALPPVLAIHVAGPGVAAAAPFYPAAVAARAAIARSPEPVALWHAFHHALLAEAHLRRLARLAAVRTHPPAAPQLALAEVAAASDAFAVLPFIWRDEHELADRSAA